MLPLLFNDDYRGGSSERADPSYYVLIGRPRSYHPVLYVTTVDGATELLYRAAYTLS
jgi:hypothetical protein